ncbi:hypothetical protein HK104_009249 [Borealophlyctis nickersoniae]|nr:hypothetical protein HK104_009249 [Borealophlyctis nickersoniae]
MTSDPQDRISIQSTDAVVFDSTRESIKSWIATLTDSESKLKERCTLVLSNLGQSHSQDSTTRESMLTLKRECEAVMARLAARAECSGESECEFLRMQNAELSEKQAKLKIDYETLLGRNQELVADLRAGTSLAAKLLQENCAAGGEIAVLKEQNRELLAKIDAEMLKNRELASRSKTVDSVLESRTTELRRLENEEKNAHAEKNKLTEENVKLSNELKRVKAMWKAVGQQVEELRAHVARDDGDLNGLPLEAPLGDALSTFANPTQSRQIRCLMYWRLYQSRQAQAKKVRGEMTVRALKLWRLHRPRQSVKKPIHLL